MLALQHENNQYAIELFYFKTLYNDEIRIWQTAH